MAQSYITTHAFQVVVLTNIKGLNILLEKSGHTRGTAKSKCCSEIYSRSISIPLNVKETIGVLLIRSESTDESRHTLS